jgi:hypothetical protein
MHNAHCSEKERNYYFYFSKEFPSPSFVSISHACDTAEIERILQIVAPLSIIVSQLHAAICTMLCCKKREKEREKLIFGVRKVGYEWSERERSKRRERERVREKELTCIWRKKAGFSDLDPNLGECCEQKQNK